MKHVVILTCEKCGKTVEFPGNVLQPSIARAGDPYWGYAPTEKYAEEKHKKNRTQFLRWDNDEQDRHELCPECKEKHWKAINNAKKEAEKAFWRNDES